MNRLGAAHSINARLAAWGIVVKKLLNCREVICIQLQGLDWVAQMFLAGLELQELNFVVPSQDEKFDFKFELQGIV